MAERKIKDEIDHSSWLFYYGHAINPGRKENKLNAKANILTPMKDIPCGLSLVLTPHTLDSFLFHSVIYDFSPFIILPIIISYEDHHLTSSLGYITTIIFHVL